MINAVDMWALTPPTRSSAAALPATSARSKLQTVESIDDKLGVLARLIVTDRTDPRIDAALGDALGRRQGGRWAVAENDEAGELRAIYDYVRRTVRYTSDMHGVDTFRRPVRTLEFGIGDCDDSSTLLAALASAAGYPIGLRIVRTSGNDDWNHIYNVVGVPRRDPTRWVPIDATVDRGPGWEISGHQVDAVRTVIVEPGGTITELGTPVRGWSIAPAAVVIAVLLWLVRGSQ